MTSTVEFFRGSRPALLGLLTVLFCVGWVKFYFRDFLYPIDYAERMLIIFVFFFLYRGDLQDLRFNWQFNWKEIQFTSLIIFFAAIYGILLTDFISNYFLYVFLNVEFYGWGHFYYPESIYLKIFDLTIGLVLGAISEELVFRKLSTEVLVTRISNRFYLYIVSSLLFAAIHLPQKPDVPLTAFLAGLILLSLYRRTGNLWVPIAAHYLANLYFFW